MNYRAAAVSQPRSSIKRFSKRPLAVIRRSGNGRAGRERRRRERYRQHVLEELVAGLRGMPCGLNPFGEAMDAYSEENPGAPGGEQKLRKGEPLTPEDFIGA